MLATPAPFSSSCKLAFDEKQFTENSPTWDHFTFVFTPPKQQVAFQEGLLTFPQFGLLSCV